MMDWTDNGTWMTGWGMLFMLLFWVGVSALVVWLVLRTAGAGAVGQTRESPRQVLDRRLASGELTPAEYVAARDLLARSPDKDASTE